MPYTPNATDVNEPVISRDVMSAAQEFRTLKNSVNARIAAEEAARIAGDANLQLAVNAVVEDLQAEMAASLQRDTALSQAITAGDNGVRAEFAAADAGLHNEIQAVAADLYAEGQTRAAADTTLSGRLTVVEQLAYNGSIPGTVLKTQYTATEGQTVFALPLAPLTVANVNVYLQGVYQHQNTFTVSGSTVTLSEGVAVGTLVEIETSAPLQLGTTSADLVEYLTAGSGAVARTTQDKLREHVSAKDFGATGNGTSDDSAAIQAALNTGKAVYLPKGVYNLGAPITLIAEGQRLYGESGHSTYLVGGVTHDLVRVAASHCEVDHIHFRPGGYSDSSPAAFAPLRIYASLSHIHDNRFLAAATNHGTAILLDDVDPATAAVVAGAYVHTIENNRIGASGYSFLYSIYSYSSNNGQQGTKFQNNQILGNTCIYVLRGGGNYYVGNLLQSATGGYGIGTRAGNAIDLQANVIGETITGNYIERYQHGVILRRATTDYVVANVYGNHFDNNDSNLISTGSGFYRFVNDEILSIMSNTWQENFNSQDNLKLYNREGVEVYNVNRASASFEPRVLSHNQLQSLSFLSNDATRTPESSWCEITGSGGHRTGCFLGNGTRPGQHLYLRAHTWSVQLLNNPGGTQNIYFASNAANVTFGQSGNIGTMHLIWDAAYGSGRWFEMSRTVA